MKLIYKGFLVAALVSVFYLASITATATEQLEGDEVEAVMSYDTSKTDETPNQIEGTCMIPEGFGLNAYIELKNQDGLHYFISVSQENGYEDRLYVANGTYSFVSAGVYGDNTNQYQFEVIDGEDITVDGEENSFGKFTVKISDFDAIKDKIDENKDESKTNSPAAVISPTGLEGVGIDNTGELFFKTECKSKNGIVEIHGNAIDDYKIYIEIIEQGVVGEAKFKLSLDGGQTFIGDDITEDEFDLSSYGIKINFRTAVDTDELMVGDTFTAVVPATFRVTQSNPTVSNVVVAGKTDESFQFKLDILSSEGLGKAKFSVSLNNGHSNEVVDTIPESGVYELKGLKIYFYTTDSFSKGDQYLSSIEKNVEESSYLGIVVISVMAGILFIVFLVYILMHAEKKTDYILNTWDEMQPEEAYR